MDILKINDFKEYFEYLSKNKEDHIILICSRSNIGKDISDVQADLIQSLGIKTDFSSKRGLNGKHRRGYYAVIDGEEVIAEELGSDEKTLRYKDKRFFIKSTVYTHDKGVEPASILVDKTEYCANKKGLNVVVIDKKTGRPIDSINFYISSEAWELKRNSKTKKRMISENKVLKTFDEVKRVTSGMSSVGKYRVTQGENKLFLRMYNSEKFDRKEYEVGVMNELVKIGVPLAKPVEFGKHESIVYYTTEWLEGKILSSKIRELSSKKVYDIGIMAGKALKLMHGLPVDSSEICWSIKYADNFDELMVLCEEKGLKFHKLDVVRAYFNKHRHLLETRPQGFVHNDYGVHNIMISKKKLTFFDFDTLGFGDPWIDFVQIIPRDDKVGLREKDATSFFATGCINGYFSDENGVVNLPEDFWKLFTLYSIVRRIQSAVRVIDREQSAQMKLAELENFYAASDDMMEDVPKWYRNTMELLQDKPHRKIYTS